MSPKLFTSLVLAGHLLKTVVACLVITMIVSYFIQIPLGFMFCSTLLISLATKGLIFKAFTIHNHTLLQMKLDRLKALIKAKEIS